MNVRLLTVENAARYVGTTPGAVRMRIFRGIYPPHILVRQGNRIYIDKPALDEFIEDSRCKRTPRRRKK